MCMRKCVCLRVLCVTSFFKPPTSTLLLLLPPHLHPVPFYLISFQRHREDLLRRYAATSFSLSSSSSPSSSKTTDELILENADLKALLAEKEKLVDQFKGEMDAIIAGLKALGLNKDG